MIRCTYRSISIGNLTKCLSWYRHRSHRTFSGTRDVRLAGRRRFYKDVGVQPVSPPWQRFTADTNTDVRIPGGAGIDGTDSASGISLDRPSFESMREILDPLKGDAVSLWYTVTLDSRPLLTPLGTPLSLPSLPLALMVASEWHYQGKNLQPTQMPLTTLCCTALDQITIPAVRIRTVEKLLSYLKTDTTCYWADPLDDRVLHRKQKIAWEGLHDWASSGKNGLKAYFKNMDENTKAIDPLLATTTGIGFINTSTASKTLPHTPQALHLAETFLMSLNAWKLTAMQAATMEAKSFLVGFALITGSSISLNQDADRKDLSLMNSIPFADNTVKAVAAARVEEEFQIESWGLVEGQHDYDRLNSSIQIHSAVLLSNCVDSVFAKN